MRYDIVALIGIFLATSLPAQRTPTQFVRNDPAWTLQGGLRSYAKGLGDISGDGVPDYAVAAPRWPVPGAFGRVYLYSGRTGTVFLTLDGTQANQGFGRSIADVGDVDGDLRSDVAIGSPEYDDPAGGVGQGRIQVFSGATGAQVWSLVGTVQGGNLGKDMEAQGGLIGGSRNLVVSEQGWSDPAVIGSGRIVFLDGASGAMTSWAPGTVVYGGLGHELAAAPDVAGIYATSDNGDVWSINPGTGGGTGTATLAFTAPAGAGGYPSIAVLAGPTPGSGRIAVGWSSANSNGFNNNGTVDLYPVGGTTSVLTLHGPHSSSFFGQRVARALDVDGDGEDEMIVLANASPIVAPNVIRVFSQSGALVDQATRAGANTSVLTSVGDVTGDGRGEWISAIGTGSTPTFECALFSLGLDIGTTTTTGTGTTWTYSLDAGPSHGGESYLQGYSLSGAHPGTTGPMPWPLIPLNVDDLTFLAVSLAGTIFLPDPIGTLDGSGTQATTLFLPAGAVSGLQGESITTCFVTVVAGAPTFASNPVTISF